MQLAPIAQLPVVHGLFAPARTGAATPFVAPARPSTEPAPASAPAAVAGAVDGVARLTNTGTPVETPIVDFPGIGQGDTFKIVKGSKVGFLGVKGDATITTFTPDAATFAIKAGAFGVKVDVTVEVVTTGPDTVRISSHGTGIPNVVAEGRVVERRTNFVEFERIDNPSEHTVISHDGNGRIEIDTVVPTFGNAHMILVKN